jgi:hypothetical protein
LKIISQPEPRSADPRRGASALGFQLWKYQRQRMM